MPAEPLTATPEDAPGFYGKLPARGDFVGRRLGRAFVDGWDAWLQQAILASRAALGGAWLDTYLTSPLWRFALAPGCCGPHAVAGVMMPSVDAVGRYFPLTLGRELAGAAGAAVPEAAWYDALETLALAALDDGFSLDDFDRPLPPHLAAPGGPPDAASEALPAPGLHIALAAGADIAALCRRHGGGPAARSALWWSAGSARVSPSFLACPGLPVPEAFPAMLDGDWPARGWRSSLSTDAAPPAKLDEAASEPQWDREE